MAREKMSRPRSSVPNRCCDDGPASAAEKSLLPGANGAITGAKIAMKTKMSATTSPATASGRRSSRRRMRRRPRARGLRTAMSWTALIASAPPGSYPRRWANNDAVSSGPPRHPDARVEVRVCDVDEQVDDHVPDGRDEDHALDQRIVALLHRLDRQAPEAGDHEDLLGDHRARDQRAELESHHRDDRQQAVAHRVADDRLPVAEP